MSTRCAVAFGTAGEDNSIYRSPDMQLITCVSEVTMFPELSKLTMQMNSRSVGFDLAHVMMVYHEDHSQPPTDLSPGRPCPRVGML